MKLPCHLVPQAVDQHIRSFAGLEYRLHETAERFDLTRKALNTKTGTLKRPNELLGKSGCCCRIALPRPRHELLELEVVARHIQLEVVILTFHVAMRGVERCPGVRRRGRRFHVSPSRLGAPSWPSCWAAIS